MKGKDLSESDVAKVVELMRRNSCIFKAHVIEMSIENPAEVNVHQMGTANGLTANLTDKYRPEHVEFVWGLRSQLEAMPPQLYIQYSIMNELLIDLIREVPLYWSQRRMKELLSFHWMVDSKGTTDLTKSEKWWSLIKQVLVQSKLAKEPLTRLMGLDYSEFDKKFQVPMPTYLKESILPYETGYDLKLLLDESFSFSSGNDFGLELVDILTNATRRALKGNLSKAGWVDIPRLMIAQKGQYLRFRTFGNSARINSAPYRRLITNEFATGGRTMLTNRKELLKNMQGG